MISFLSSLDFKGVLQIAILTWLIYRLFSFFRGTRSAQLLFGVVSFFVCFSAVAFLLKLDVLIFITSRLSLVLVYAALVIFHPEIRQAFHAIGNRKFTIANESVKDKLIDIVSSAAEMLSKRKHGALIVIERNSHLLEFAKTGTTLESPIVLQLLTSIFWPGAPLHDGAVIIKGEMILAARCVLPLSDNDTGRGTRHRAALGISEKTDAVVVVVSEETGSISIACGGHMVSDLSKETLTFYLSKLLHKEGVSLTIKRSIAELQADGQSASAQQAKEEAKSSEEVQS